MKIKYSQILLVLVPFSLSFCGEKDIKVRKAGVVAEAVGSVKKSGAKCCSSVPDRFSVKGKLVTGPEKLN